MRQAHPNLCRVPPTERVCMSARHTYTSCPRTCHVHLSLDKALRLLRICTYVSSPYTYSTCTLHRGPCTCKRSSNVLAHGRIRDTIPDRIFSWTHVHTCSFAHEANDTRIRSGTCILMNICSCFARTPMRRTRYCIRNICSRFARTPPRRTALRY